MSSIEDYLGNLRGERSKMVERAAAANDLVADIKGLAQLQLAIIATEAVARETSAAHRLNAAIEDINRVAAAREAGLI